MNTVEVELLVAVDHCAVLLSRTVRMLPVLTKGMTIGSSGGVGSPSGAPWSGFKVDSVSYDLDTHRMTAFMADDGDRIRNPEERVQRWLERGWEKTSC